LGKKPGNAVKLSLKWPRFVIRLSDLFMRKSSHFLNKNGSRRRKLQLKQKEELNMKLNWNSRGRNISKNKKRLKLI
jgi:hypothetical protein